MSYEFKFTIKQEVFNKFADESIDNMNKITDYLNRSISIVFGIDSDQWNSNNYNEEGSIIISSKYIIGSGMEDSKNSPTLRNIENFLEYYTKKIDVVYIPSSDFEITFRPKKKGDYDYYEELIYKIADEAEISIDEYEIDEDENLITLHDYNFFTDNEQNDEERERSVKRVIKKYGTIEN